MRSALRLLADVPVAMRMLTGCACLLVVGLAATAWTGGAAEQSDEPTGAVEAVVVDGDEEAGENERRSASRESVSRRTAEGANGAKLHGSMVGSYIVSLYSEEGYWVDIGRGGDVHVPLQEAWGHAKVTVADNVPVGTYTRVRITMCHSGARLDPGTRVGSHTVDAPTGLKLTETGDVFVRRDVEPFTVEEHRLVRLEIDLNAERWVTPAALESGRIDVPTFERAVEVSIMTSPK